MTDEYYSYREALEIVEDFMVKSGIRKYCETICKGYCCGLCSESENACFRNEGRRLPCSIYLCKPLLEIVPNKETLFDLIEDIELTLREIMEDNPYFNPNTKDVQAKFHISKKQLDVLKSFNLLRYRRITKYLIEKNIAVVNLRRRRLNKIKFKFSRHKRERNIWVQPRFCI